MEKYELIQSIVILSITGILGIVGIFYFIHLNNKEQINKWNEISRCSQCSFMRETQNEKTFFCNHHKRKKIYSKVRTSKKLMYIEQCLNFLKRKLK